jgi:hypothetical protein
MNPNLAYQPSRKAQLAIPHEFTEPVVKAWLADLPVVDADYAGDVLLHGLRVLGRTAGLSARARLALLEAIRGKLLAVVEESVARSSHDEVQFPLTDAASRTLHRNFSLSMELGEAYQRVVLADGSGGDGLRGGLRAQMTHRALEAKSLAMLRLYENYQSLPQHFWEGVYALYRDAVQNGLELEPVADAASGATVFAQFMRIVLAALANVFRYRPREIRQVHAILGVVADKAEMFDIPVRDDQKAQFYLDLGVDAPPQPILSLKGQGPIERRFVMTQLLVKAATKHFAEAENRRIGTVRISKTLLASLLRSVLTPDRRRTRRYPESGKHRVYLGLAALSDYLVTAVTHPALADDEELALFSGANWLQAPNYTVEDIHREAEDEAAQTEDRMGRTDRQAGRLLEEHLTTVRSEDIWPGGGQAGTVSTWTGAKPDVWLLNSSAQGYCLLWASKEVSGARVGELMGVAGAAGGTYLGVIRWLQHNTDDDLMLGLELVSPEVEGGRAWPLSKPAAERKILHVAANPKLQREAAVFAAPGNFEVGQVVELETPAATRVVKLERVVASTPAFVAFAVSSVARSGIRTAVV